MAIRSMAVAILNRTARSGQKWNPPLATNFFKDLAPS